MNLTLTDRTKRLEAFLSRAHSDIEASTIKMRNILYHNKSANELIIAKATRFKDTAKEFNSELKLFKTNLRKYERCTEKISGKLLSFIPGTEAFGYKQKASHHLTQVEKLFNKLILTKLDLPQPKPVAAPKQKNETKIFKSFTAFFHRNKVMKAIQTQPSMQEGFEPMPRLKISPNH